MNKEYKPRGYNAVSPYFIVKGAKKLADILIAVFDARKLRSFDGPGGTIMHLELGLDDSVIMISDATDQYPAITQLVHVYVPDVDAVFNKALALGCTAIEMPQQKEGDPDKRGMFKDFADNLWAIGTQV